MEATTPSRSVKKVPKEAGIGWLVRRCYEPGVSTEEKMRQENTDRSNSSCVIFEMDVWSIVSMN